MANTMHNALLVLTENIGISFIDFAYYVYDPDERTLSVMMKCGARIDGIPLTPDGFIARYDEHIVALRNARIA